WIWQAMSGSGWLTDIHGPIMQIRHLITRLVHKQAFFECYVAEPGIIERPTPGLSIGTEGFPLLAMILLGFDVQVMHPSGNLNNVVWFY
ncbi:MAG TPA: hypothetical protein VN843_27500, partial [Anaerolineales bacterium]|nr:hypothetical protein [Anaerolineales bacterium]